MYIYNHIYVYTFYNMAVLKKFTSVKKTHWIVKEIRQD